jgi:adenylosuccinate synthase
VVERVVVVSGAVGSGKSTLARGICERFSGKLYSTRELILRDEGVDRLGRRELQAAGDRLDRRRPRGSWIRNALSAEIAELEGYSLAVIDAARIEPQIAHLRKAFGRRLVHVHITASDETLRTNYEKRRAGETTTELPSYREVKANATEQAIERLADHADIVINTDRSTPESVLIRVVRALSLVSQGHSACVDVVIGGEYGSEGKGNIAFYLAPEYDLLIRVGGPNAGHKVRLPSGETYTHHHLPSGTRAGNANLLLGPGCVLDPARLMQEIAECAIDKDRLAIDPRAMLIDPDDRERESRWTRIGSTRQGVGAATARRILRGMDKSLPKVRLAGDDKDLSPFCRPAHDTLEAAYAAGHRIMLEGTQGSGLSIYHGPYPHVTSRDTGVAGALSEAGIAPRRVRRVVMVCRTLPIRVGGKSGPLARELEWSEVERRAGFPRGSIEATERTSTTNRQRRVGEFEWDLLRRSAVLNAPTDVALTFVDYIKRQNQDARRFEQLTVETIHFIEEVERVAGAPVTLISTGFADRPSIVDRRSW